VGDHFGNPDGTVYIELRHIYDGISVAQLPDGTMRNLWPADNRRHAATQVWIAAMQPTATKLHCSSGPETELNLGADAARGSE
jgi:hypothetical protein